MNKVIARYADGRMLKGFTSDFNPAKDQFHVTPVEEGGVNAVPIKVLREELKALFFVKDFAGNPAHDEKKEFDSARALSGRKLRVQFNDGEVLIGTTLGYQPGRPGFFLESVDDESNIERCYVVSGSTSDVKVL